MKRRDFLVSVGAAAVGAAVPVDRLAAALAPPLYPPMDLSRFDTAITPAPADITFGYAAITWGGNDRQAIEEIPHGIPHRAEDQFGVPREMAPEDREIHGEVAFLI